MTNPHENGAPRYAAAIHQIKGTATETATADDAVAHWRRHAASSGFEAAGDPDVVEYIGHQRPVGDGDGMLGMWKVEGEVRRAAAGPAGFLLDRVRDDEQTARDASPDAPRWEFSESAWHSWDVRTVGEKSYQITTDSEGLSDSVIDHDAGEHIARHDPARVLDDCKAKRRIVEEYLQVCADYRVAHTPTLEGQRLGLAKAIAYLILPYADHEDYDEGWRP